MKSIKTRKNSKERGIATIEAALLLSIFVVFMTYCVGTFGIIHTGVMNSISARAYAFETFRNRANVVYFRDSSYGDFDQTAKYGVRLHGIVSEKETSNKWTPTERPLAQGREIAEVKANRPQDEDKMNNLYDKKRELSGEVNPVFIKTVYGICLNYECGG